MPAFIIRTFIVYFVVIISVRFMGKRQIGELQPAELVITILMSEIASMSLQDGNSPLLVSIAGILLLASLEVLFSCLAMKSGRLRTLFQGHSVLIVEKGRLKQENMKLIRYSTDDLMQMLRQKDIFDLEDVAYAYVETNGAVSVMLKADRNAVTAGDLGIKKNEAALPCLVISDGKIVEREFSLCNMNRQKLRQILNEKKLSQKDILLMTADSSGKTTIVLREKKEQ